MRGYTYEIRDPAGIGSGPYFSVVRRHVDAPKDAPWIELAMCSRRNYAEGFILAIRKADKLDEVDAILLKCGIG